MEKAWTRQQRRKLLKSGCRQALFEETKRNYSFSSDDDDDDDKV